MFPVAGLGTRMLPMTRAVPKEMLPVVDRPLVQYAVDEAIAAGVSHLVFVTDRSAPALEAHFGPAPDLAGKVETGPAGERLDAARALVPPGVRLSFVPPGAAARARSCRVVRARSGGRRAVRGGAAR